MLAVEQFNSYEYFFNFMALSLLLLPCYRALNSERWRRLLMTLAGVYLIFLIAPRLLVFYAVFWTLTYFVHRFAFIEAGSAGAFKKNMGVLALTFMPALILPMVLWKMMGDAFTFKFIAQMNQAVSLFSTRAWEIDILQPLVVPLGLSFATFRAIDLLVKTYLGTVGGLSFGQVMFYGFFPPVQIIGPIIEWEEIARQDVKPEPQIVMDGLLRIGTGFIKVFVLAAMLEDNAKIFAAPHEWAAWLLWIKLAGYSWFFYLNFSGYSDIAIGTAAVYGFSLKSNFNFPYFQPNIQAFWNNWHMSLTRWAQRNVFVPAGGYRKHTQYTALFLTMMAIALWHNINLSMIIFGIYHFSAQVVYRKKAARAQHTGKGTRAGRFCGALLTYATVLVSLPLIFNEPDKAFAFYKALAGQ